jgi:multiple sugar transport system permease protein
MTVRTAPAFRAARRIPWLRYTLWLLLGIGSIIMIVPFYWTVVTAFKPTAEIQRFPPTWWPEQPTLDHWRSLTDLSVGSFPVFFRNSVFVTTVITLVTLLTSSLSGYVFAKFDFPGRNKIFVVVLAMMIIPFSITLIPSYALMVRLDWINNYLALIMPVAFNPFGIFLMRQFMHGIPDELLDAARMDGAGEWQIFFRIVLPLASAGLAALGILTFIGQWDNFLWPLVVLDDPDLYTIPLGLAQFRGRLGTNVGGLAAGAMVAVLPVLIMFLFAQRRFIEGITLSGLKG